MITLSTLISILNNSAIPQFSGGFTGYYLSKFLRNLFSNTGAYIIIIMLNLIGLILLGVFSFSSLVGSSEKRNNKLSTLLKYLFKKISSYNIRKKIPFSRIDKELQKKRKKKKPWIIKKRIIINNNEGLETQSRQMQLLELDATCTSEEETTTSSNDVNSFPEDTAKEIDNHHPDPIHSFDWLTDCTVENDAQTENSEYIESSMIKEVSILQNIDKIPSDSIPLYGDIEQIASELTIHDAIPRSQSLELYTKDFPTNSKDDTTLIQQIIKGDTDIFDENNLAETSIARPLENDETKDFLNEFEDDDLSKKIEINRIKSIYQDHYITPEIIQIEKENNPESNDFDTCKNKIESDNFKEGDNSLRDNESPAYPRVFNEIKINEDYCIPIDCLQTSTPLDIAKWKTEAVKNTELLINTLKEFGIESRVTDVKKGPVITLYEMQIAPGIKINKIVGLADDISMALSAFRVRIVAPIPGKSVIGVEIPNKKRAIVTLGDILKAPEYNTIPGKLKVSLGKDILGKLICLDLKVMPHLLIAGATGSGKSVCVNSILTSLIYNYSPNYLKFILVDPKVVELQLYNGIPHLLTPVITDTITVPKALKWAMYEMERRYRLLSEVNTRDISRYNEKIQDYSNKFESLPYIVIIIDELSDLMMVASKEIEGFITRIAQKSRAVGIHLILATQRPSVDVITGVIKANFPARITFQVAQKTDSRTIIDQNGAEKLLGMGDMLYQSPSSSHPIRIQGAYISEEEIMGIVRHIRTIGKPSYIDIDDSLFDDEEGTDTGGIMEDQLFVEALHIVEETKKASASYLQRRLSIGYNRAARIIEMMEDRGYIGAQQGSKPREVFI